MRSCEPVMNRACPRVPLLDGPCSFGVFFVVGLRVVGLKNRGGRDALLKRRAQTDFFFAGFVLAFAAC